MKRTADSSMPQPPKQPCEWSKNKSHNNPSLRFRPCQALGAGKNARQNEVGNQDANDDEGQCGGWQVRLNGALGAEEPRGASTAAGLKVVQTIGGEGGGGTKVAGAVDGVASGAAACAAITGA